MGLKTPSNDARDDPDGRIDEEENEAEEDEEEEEEEEEICGWMVELVLHE